MQTISFPFNSRQGRFLIIYASCGTARILSFGTRIFGWSGNPADLLHSASFAADERALQAFRIYNWQHPFDVAGDCLNLDECQRTEKYRRIFLLSDIGQTPLEQPQAALLPSVEFPVTMHTGEVLRCVVSSGGHGYVLGEKVWTSRSPEASGPMAAETVSNHSTATDVLSCSCPYPLVQHDIDPDLIVSDALALSRLQNGDVGRRKIERVYEELFWQRLNPRLQYPWIRTSDELANRALSCAGSLDELLELLAAAVHLNDGILYGSDETMTLYAVAGDADALPSIDLMGGDNLRLADSTIGLMETILRSFKLTVYSIRPTGSHRLNWRGYTLFFEYLEIPVKPPTATERMEALVRLIEWSEKSGVAVKQLLPHWCAT